MTARPTFAILALTVLGACQGSHVTETPVAPPPAVHERPDVSGEVTTVRISAGPDAAHLHLVLIRTGVDPREADVPAHPSSAEVATFVGDVPHDARVVVVPSPELAHGDAIAILDALRAAGYTRFAISR